MLGIVSPMDFLLGILTFYSIYLMLSISLNLEYGYAGIPNFGKVMFFAGGAFTIGAFVTRFVGHIIGLNLSNYYIRNVILATEVDKYFSSHPHLAISIFLLTLMMSALIGAILGYIASYPAIRLKADYLGITLIASGEVLRIIAKNYKPLVCGSLGVAVPNPFVFIDMPLRGVVQCLVMLGIAIGCWYFVEILTRSPFGRVLRAVREDELATAAFGRDVVKIKMKALVIGSAISGLAGGLYAYYIGVVHPDDFAPLWTFTIWVMVIIGGMGNNFGSAIGALAYTVVERLTMYYKDYIPLPFNVVYLGYIAFAIVLILMLMYRPAGLMPEKPIMTINFEAIRKRIYSRMAKKTSSNSHR